MHHCFSSPDCSFDPSLLKQVKNLELLGVSAAESGDLKTALSHLNQAIQILPMRASAYNNRAQVKRLQGDTDSRLLLCTTAFIQNLFRIELFAVHHNFDHAKKKT